MNGHTLPSNTHRLTYSLWVNWTIVVAALCITLVIPFFMAKTLMPLPVLAMSYVLLVLSKRRPHDGLPICSLILRYGMWVLFWSAIIMELIMICTWKDLYTDIFNRRAVNPEIPFITSLILSPVMCVMALWMLLLGANSGFCRRCRAENDYSYETNTMSLLFTREARYQLQLFALLSFCLGVVQYWYYFAYYINVNMNTPDRFFFNYMPMVIYGFTCGMMLMRYSNMAVVIGPVAQALHEQSTIIRYLVLSGDRLLLKELPDGHWDTPVIADIKTDTKITEELAKRKFDAITHLDDASLRYLYTNHTFNNANEIVHYAAFVTDEKSEKDFDGEWLTLDMIDRLMKSSRLTIELSSEIYRIFTITIAWKTYDRDGKRLYPIKHYRPTFRLRDFSKWTVDYDDLSWIAISRNNEDRPFFRTRRMWQKLTGSAK